MREGLGRHDAIHAIGSVLIDIVFDAMAERLDASVDINARYGRELAELTAPSWRAQALISSHQSQSRLVQNALPAFERIQRGRSGLLCSP
jgi:hypothetical protein